MLLGGMGAQQAQMGFPQVGAFGGKPTFSSTTTSESLFGSGFSGTVAAENPFGSGFGGSVAAVGFGGGFGGSVAAVGFGGGFGGSVAAGSPFGGGFGGTATAVGPFGAQVGQSQPAMPGMILTQGATPSATIFQSHGGFANPPFGAAPGRNAASPLSADLRVVEGACRAGRRHEGAMRGRCCT
jgi:hypothetical protein